MCIYIQYQVWFMHCVCSWAAHGFIASCFISEALDAFLEEDDGLSVTGTDQVVKATEVTGSRSPCLGRICLLWGKVYRNSVGGATLITWLSPSAGQLVVGHRGILELGHGRWRAEETINTQKDPKTRPVSQTSEGEILAGGIGWRWRLRELGK